MTTRQHVEVGVAADTTITVTRLAASARRPQGLILDADHPLRVGDRESTRVVLWSATAPDTVEITATRAGPLRVWNVWCDGNLTQAWQGAAGIDIDDEGDLLCLTCRDGHGDSAQDLVVELSFDRAWTQPADD